MSDQSVTTTHSPEIAAYYLPHEVLILRNNDGQLKSIPLIPHGEEVPDKNALMQLYTVHRAAICEALMHHTVIVPEGKTEFQWFRALMRLRATVEGWENTCEGDEAIGIVPTTDAHVVAIYERFQPLVQRVVPLVDGDIAGDEYVKKLLKANPTPSLILQLETGSTLENVIAWLLGPDAPSEWGAIAAILTNLTLHTQEALVAELTANKTNWRLHEDLLSYIGTNDSAKSRIGVFCDGLCEVAVNGSTSKACWSQEKGRSKPSTAVWRWGPV